MNGAAIHTILEDILARYDQKHPYNHMIPSPIESAAPLPAFIAQENRNYTPSVVGIIIRYLHMIDQAPSLELVLTLRKEHLSHGGQISFAGGRVDPGEESKKAILREIHEELGINSGDITLVGQLPNFYLHHSNHQITPYIGIIDYGLSLTPNPEEVQEILSIPIQDFFNPSLYKESLWTLRNQSYRVPYFDVHKIPLWGATAMILAEWLKVYSSHENEVMSGLVAQKPRSV